MEISRGPKSWKKERKKGIGNYESGILKGNSKWRLTPGESRKIKMNKQENLPVLLLKRMSECFKKKIKVSTISRSKRKLTSLFLAIRSTSNMGLNILHLK